MSWSHSESQKTALLAALSFVSKSTGYSARWCSGPRLQKIPQYLKFILFFQVWNIFTSIFMKYFLPQAVHPLTTTGLAPLVLLSILNYKVGSDWLRSWCFWSPIIHEKYQQVFLYNNIVFQVYSHIKQSRKFFPPNSRRSREFLMAKTMMVVVLGTFIQHFNKIKWLVFERENYRIVQKWKSRIFYNHFIIFIIKTSSYLVDNLQRTHNDFDKQIFRAYQNFLQSV